MYNLMNLKKCMELYFHLSMQTDYLNDHWGSLAPLEVTSPSRASFWWPLICFLLLWLRLLFMFIFFKTCMGVLPACPSMNTVCA